MSKFIFCLGVFALINVIHAGEVPDVVVNHVKMVIKECAERSNGAVTEEQLGELLKASKEGNPGTPSNDMKCAIRCLLEKGEMMNSDNDDVKVSDKFEPEIKKAIEDCVSNIKSSGCDKAYDVKLCMLKIFKE